jgi:hypothetical protein
MSGDLMTAGRRSTVRPLRVGVSRPWALVPDLARVHAVRILRHPVFLLGMLWYVVALFVNPPTKPYDQYTMLTALPIFLVGIPVFIAVNLVATSSRRAGVDDWTGALPFAPVHRTAAMLLASAAPAVFVAAIQALTYVSYRGIVTLVVPWTQLACVPVSILGAGLLGVAVARLLPWPGAPLAVAVALVSVNLWVSGPWPYLGAYCDFVLWTTHDVIPARIPGSSGWHLTYLLALCGLAATGALLSVARRRWLPLAAGVVFGVLVLVAGFLQLP